MGLFLMTTGLGSLLGSALVQIVNVVSYKVSKIDWYDGKDIDQGRLEYFFYLLAALLAVNFLVFCAIASRYTYVGEEVLRKDQDDWFRRKEDRITPSIDEYLTTNDYSDG